MEDENLRKEAYNKLKLISRFNGPNDGQAIKSRVDIVTNKQELDIEFHYDSPLETRIKELNA